MKAVGVGYVFNLFDDGDLFGVDLRETGEYVRVDGSIYPLMKAATYEQSRMVDAAIDVRGERRLDDFLWKEPRLPDGRGALAALLGGDDFYIDLLFYNLNLRCYVVIELKTSTIPARVSTSTPTSMTGSRS